MISPCQNFRSPTSAHTLVEILTVSAILSIVFFLLMTTTSELSRGVQNVSSNLEAYQGARTALDSVSRALTVATLNTFWDYYNAENQPRTSANAASFQPERYGRQSDLHFLATSSAKNFPLPVGMETVSHALFFQVPYGYPGGRNPQSVLNPIGFFIAFGNDPTKPGIAQLEDRPRFRLYQWLPPSVSLSSAADTGRLSDDTWITPETEIHPLGENIIVFVARVPRENNGDTIEYGWDSLTEWTSDDQPYQMHQLPQLVEITMVGIEEGAANRLAGEATSAAEASAFLGVENLETLFSDPESFETDLATVKDGLQSRGVPYRVFQTTISLRGSRWSP
jgi:uncharacterized protein (TIGR02599 family)